MRFLPLTACALLFALPAKADKFWLTSPEAQKNQTAGSSPEVVEGVLVAEDNDGYHIRIVGGELILPRSAVHRIEKDGLTLEAIVKVEKDNAEKLATQNRERELAQQAQQKAREIAVVEAASRREPPRAVPAVAPTPLQVVSGFDPVVGVMRGPDLQAEMMMQARANWDATRDRRYLVLLRQLRRLR
jgi:hypothetical protein